jgi:hypothetical protein
MGLDVGPHLLADHIAHLAPGHFRLGPAEPVLLRAIDVAVATLDIDVGHRHRDLVHDGAQSPLRALRGLERTLVVRDIEREQLAADDRAPLVLLREQLDLQRLQGQIPLQGRAAKPLHAAGQRRLDVRPQLGGGHRVEGIVDRPPLDFVAGTEQPACQRRARVGAAPLGIHQGHHREHAAARHPGIAAGLLARFADSRWRLDARRRMLTRRGGEQHREGERRHRNADQRARDHQPAKVDG